jgi:IclR family transcriptional regulator, KDG regulon repressor
MLRTRSAANDPNLVAAADDTRQRGGIQSLERAFAILEDVARSRDGISLAELSKHLGLHTSTTFHLVQTMVSLGYVRQVRETRRYRIGRPLFALAAAARDEIELVSMATPVLEELSAESGETGHFGVWSGGAVLVLAKTPGAGAFQIAGTAGVVRPAYATGLGKALLAALSPQQLERFLATTELRPLTPKTLVEPDRLRHQLDEIRRNGIAFDDGEFDVEVRCVAAPIRDFTGQVCGAIGMSGPIWRLSLQGLQEKAQLVCRAAVRLSQALGYVPQEAAEPRKP